MLKIFKPNYLVIEIVHERYTFDTYYTYCRHMTLKEIEEQFILDEKIRKVNRNGIYIYDDCGEYENEFPTLADDEYEFNRYNIEYTIVIPKKKMKSMDYFICGNTNCKFGLYDKKWVGKKNI